MFLHDINITVIMKISIDICVYSLEAKNLNHLPVLDSTDLTLLKKTGNNANI